MNPRYLAYCRAHGRTPDDMLAFDEQAWPGGKMCGFILWMSEQWAAFTKLYPHNIHIRTDEIHAAFDAWQEKTITAPGGQ